MVFLNLQALYGIIGTILTFGCLDYLFPSIMEGEYGGFYFAFIIIFIGAINNKGRLLFLPVWLYGVLFFLLLTWGKWGGIGLAVAMLSPIPLICVLSFGFEAINKKKLRAAPELLEKAKFQHANGNNQEMWACLRKSFIVPVLGVYSKGIYTHNIAVISFLTGELKDFLAQDHIEKLDRLNSYFEAAKDKKEKNEDEQKDLVDFTVNLISSAGKFAPERES